MDRDLLETLSYYCNFSQNWPVSVLLALMLILLFRYLFLHRIIKKIKAIDKQMYKTITTIYIKRAALGWLFFVLGGVILVLWRLKPEVLESHLTAQAWFIMTILLFIWGSFCHLHFYSSGLISVLKQKTEIEKTF